MISECSGPEEPLRFRLIENKHKSNGQMRSKSVFHKTRPTLSNLQCRQAWRCGSAFSWIGDAYMPQCAHRDGLIHTADSGPFTQSVTWTKIAGAPSGLGMDRTGGKSSLRPTQHVTKMLYELLACETQMEDKIACPWPVQLTRDIGSMTVNLWPITLSGLSSRSSQESGGCLDKECLFSYPAPSTDL